MSRPSGDASDIMAPVGAREEPEVEKAFDRLVEDGDNRLSRPLLPLLTTGLLGGIDIGVGVLAYLVVLHETGNSLLAAMAFTIGFVALLMGRSELFTENFLVPVTALVAGRGTVLQLIRLWVATLVMNLIGGVILAAMIVVALPDLQPTAIEAGGHYAHLGVSWRSFFLAVLGGAVITLLTRMQHASDNVGVKAIPAILMSFVLVGAHLFHAVLDSILIAAGLFSGGADYNWGHWTSALLWSVFGNLVGGLALVTTVRLLQVPHRVQEERQQNS